MVVAFAGAFLGSGAGPELAALNFEALCANGEAAADDDGPPAGWWARVADALAPAPEQVSQEEV